VIVEEMRVRIGIRQGRTNPGRQNFAGWS